ncbi:MAG: hypothetical protein M1818_001788 [Claussenomyces sp. TS43310]|nr:MAG: hypothetical protein M1818_001788 [Claussenomyces sp. TS43310]
MYYSSSPVYSPPSTPSSISSLYHISPTSPRRISDASTASCAFPSWPRRSSLSGSTSSCDSGFNSVAAQVTNFISDDDLFPDVFEDSESDCTPSGSPCRSPLAVSAREAEVRATVTVGSLPGALKEIKEMKETRDKERARARKEKRPRYMRKRSSTGKAMTPILEGGE